MKSLGLVLCALLVLSAPHAAYADDDFIVYSPHLTQGQSEVEFRAYTTQDGRNALDKAGSFELALAHTVTSWWKTELYVAGTDHDPVTGIHPSGYEFENTFQLADVGQYWADPGFIFSYVRSRVSGQPDSVELGPLFEKQSGAIIQRLNVVWQKDIGPNALRNYEFRTAYSFGYKIDATFIPGFEAYYRPNDNAHQMGPAVSGEIRMGMGDELEYGAALLYGLNLGAPDKTLIFRLEYEFFYCPFLLSVGL